MRRVSGDDDSQHKAVSESRNWEAGVESLQAGLDWFY